VVVVAAATVVVLSTSFAAAEKRDEDDHRGELDIDAGVYAAAYCVAESSTVALRRRRATVIFNLDLDFSQKNEVESGR
jgi:hypothetical protein